MKELISGKGEDHTGRWEIQASVLKYSATSNPSLEADSDLTHQI